MLSHIHIHDLGIIEDLEIEFGKGFNVITGETGAGKTLIIGAIQMLLGGKSNKDMIRTGTSKAYAEALFFVESDELKEELSKLGYNEDEIIIYREILLNGRSVAKINGKLVTVNELRELGNILVDLHGQHDNQSLLNAKKHIEVLDNFAGKKISLYKVEYIDLFEKRKEILTKVEKLGGNPEQRARTMEFLKFQIDEIESASLKENEDNELAETKKVLSNAEKVSKSLESAYTMISADNGALRSLQFAIREISEIENLNEKYKAILTLLNDAYYQAEEASYSINSEKEKIYIDEEELSRIDDRLDIIFKLKKKYGNNIENILNTYKQICEEYRELSESERILEDLEKELKVIEEKMINVANKISQIRKKTGKELETKLADVLVELEMPKSRFEIKISENDGGKFLPNGMDEVEILFSSNLGEDVKELSKVASGGEISRIMLALKNVLANADIISVMVFDEIDTGISGKAGFAVGEKMLEISKNKQVICVTHLPSIAAKGNHNFFISKINEKDKTTTHVKKLNEEETIGEIARIISGGNISSVALAHARELRNDIA